MKHLDFFEAIICDQPTHGRISIKGARTHFCQNKHKGDEVDNKLGYKFSWILDHQVKNVKVLSKNEYLKKYKIIPQVPLNVLGYQTKVSGNKVIFGCGDVTLSKKQTLDMINFLENNRSSLKLLSDILKNVDVDDLLKIKKSELTKLKKLL